MSLTLCLVSFSCTGPILGTLLVGTLTSDGGAIDLTYGMLGFGVALAIPFTLLAFFPNIINKLPKSGSWTNTIKVILGFVELALAFKFLSNVDLIQEWGLLKREVFIAIWVLISIACGIYLIIVSRRTSYIISSIFFIFIGLYMGSSLFNKSTNMSLLSGLLPPEFYSIYNNSNDCPLGLDCIKDFNEGLNESKLTKKPILLDFTGWACANCRRVEENTWSVPKVYDLINNDFVLISLYVDDRSDLSSEDIIVLKDKNGNEKILDKVGEKWSAFQTINFKNNSQPYYVLLSPDLQLLNKPLQYTDTETYYEWLSKGLENFKR
jgi:thiol:disulfide interchange protein DsbD